MSEKKTETRELTCIGCPLGCALTVTMIREASDLPEKDSCIVTAVTGNTCKRGEIYARKEVTNPTRIVTSTVRVEGGTAPMVNVKTAADIPKDKIFACIEAIRDVTVQAPVHINDVIVTNVAGTGVDMIAAKSVEARIYPASE